MTPEEYQKQAQDSYKVHVVGKLRTAYPSIAKDANDDELLQVWHRINVPDASADEAEQVLQKVYGADWEPPPVPKPTLRERVGQVGTVIKESASGMAPFLGAAILPQLAKKTLKSATGPVGQIALAGNTAIRVAGEMLAGKNLEKTAAEMSEPDIADLRAKGYSEQQIKNIVEGYVATQQSLMKDVEDIGRQGLVTSAEGITNAAFLPVGGGAISKAVQSKAAQTLTKTGVRAGLSRILSGAAGHAASGAVVGGGYMGTMSALERATQAKADGGGADDIYKAATSGLGEGIATGAVFGAAIGGGLGLVGGTVGEVANQSAARRAIAEKAVADARDATLRRFADDFRPQWLQERFPEDLRLANEQNLPDEVLAANIVRNVHGEEVLNTEEGMRTVSALFKRIQSWRAANEGLRGTMIELPEAPLGAATGLNPVLPNEAAASGIPNIARPAGASLEATGGIPPENLPPAIQGPIGERTPKFVPPAEAPVPPEGLEGAPPIVQQPPAPIEVIGNAPEVRPQGAIPTLRQPLGAEPGYTPALPEEYAPRELGEPTITPRYEPNELITKNLPPSIKAEEPTPGLRNLPTLADEAVASIGENKNLEVIPSEGGNSLQIKRLGASAGQMAEAGSSSKALEQIAAEADRRGLPVEARIEPTAGPRGGTIPLEKLLPWYESKGYKVIEKGDKFAVVRRDPVPVVPTGTIGTRVESYLTRQAEAAQERIRKRGVRLFAGGLDPEMLADYAIILSSKMFTAGLRGSKAASEWLVQQYGESIAPHVQSIYDKARQNLIRMFKSDPRARAKLQQFIKLRDSGTHGMNWYEMTADWVKENFGSDADMFLKFLGVTSADSSTEAGAHLALKAYGQWKSGLSFSGFRGESMTKNLERVARGEDAGGLKISNFIRALQGDPDAIVLDRWMIRALGLQVTPKGLREPDYKLYSKIIRDLAEQSGMTPRQFQAAIWEGSRVESAQRRFKQGGPSAVSKIGSARPLEYLIEKKLNGMTPEQWVETNKLDLDKMTNLYEGMKQARTEGGFTFDPTTYIADKTPGYIVTLANIKVPRKEFYPAALLDFRNKFSKLISTCAFGDDHITIGTFKLDSEGKNFSIDLNVTIPGREKAIELGFKNRQFEIGHIDEAGNYEGIKTGYDSKQHGRQFLPPTDPEKAKIWFRKQETKVLHLLDQIDKPISPSKETIRNEKIVNNILTKRGKIVPPKDIPINPSRTLPYWLTPDGKLYEVKSHEGVSGPAAKAMKLTEKKSGYQGSYRWDNHIMLQQGHIRIQISGKRVVAQIVGNPNEAQRKAMSTLLKGRTFEGVLTDKSGSSESDLFESWSALLRAAEKPKE